MCDNLLPQNYKHVSGSADAPSAQTEDVIHFLPNQQVRIVHLVHRQEQNHDPLHRMGVMSPCPFLGCFTDKDIEE